MEWTKLLCCLIVIFVCASASMIETLHKFDDLKGRKFGHEYPRHGLLLLHWLANHVSITQSEDILLDFDPVWQGYGFEYYESISNSTFPHLGDSANRVYYALGSLSSEKIRTKLPPYVTQDYYNAFKDPKRDLDRIVLRVKRIDPYRADKVYITQVVTSEQGVDYDPLETFEISPKLLTQIQILKNPLNLIQALESHLSGIQNLDDPRLVLTKDQLLHHLKYTNKHFQTIFEDQSVTWLLILAGYDIENRYNIHKKTWMCSTEESIQQDQISSDPETLCNGLRTVKIEVKSTENGYARVTWSGIPKNIITLNTSIVVFSSDMSSNIKGLTKILQKGSGTYDSFVPLNHGLQPRLATYGFSTEEGFIGIRYSVIWRGPQFDEASRAIPTEISGYDASLQLFTRYGFTFARIYIKNSFTTWEKEFAYSYVSFYTSDQDQDSNYKYYQWVTNFIKVKDTEEYVIYQYQSTMSIRPGAQARFLFSRDSFTRFLPSSSATVRARTIPWESKNN